MNGLSNLIAQTVASRVSAELQPHLRRFYGGLIRGYLPQTWWFSTEMDQTTLYVDQQGSCQVVDGHVGQPDADISWTSQAFAVAFTTGNRSQLPSGTPSPDVKIYTSKGQAAFDQLRKRMGL